MKTKILIYSLILFFYVQTNAQQWEALGPDDSSQTVIGNASVTSLVLDSENIPYVVYRDRDNANKASVKKLNGNVWEYVGIPGFSDENINAVSLVLDLNNTPYISYGANNKVSVMKFSNGIWESLGIVGSGTTEQNFLAIDSNGVPFVAYLDSENGNKASVKKFNGNDWEYVGNAGFSDGYTYYLNIGLDSNNNVYVAFQDNSNKRKATVMKFSEGSWNIVGSGGFSVASADYISLAFDNTDTPYVAFKDSNYRATVMKFDSINWDYVGERGFSSGEVYFTSLVFGSNNTPYLAYNNTIPFTNKSKATVKKFDQGNWVDVGLPDFSAGSVSFISLAFDTTNIPYVAYTDEAISGKGIVKKFNSLGWVDVGGDGISEGTARYSSVAVNSANIPYIVYQDIGNMGKAVVKKFISGFWTNVGNSGISNGRADFTNIAFNSNDTPYVVYQDFSNDRKITVKELSGGSWSNVGNAGFSMGRADFTNIAFDSNDTPYVVFQDSVNGNRVTVKMFNGNVWEDVGSAGFSSAEASFTDIAFDSNNTPYVVYQDFSNGRKISVNKFSGGNWIDVGNSGFSNGIASHTNLAFNNNDIPFVVYYDETEDGGRVKRFNGNTWDDVGANFYSYYTNPSSPTNLAIAFSSQDVPFVVYTEKGFYFPEDRARIKSFDGTNWLPVGVKWWLIEDVGLSETDAMYTSLSFDNLDNLMVIYTSNRAFVKKIQVNPVEPDNQIYGSVSLTFENECSLNGRPIEYSKVDFEYNDSYTFSTFTNKEGQYSYTFPFGGKFITRAKYYNTLFIANPLNYTFNFNGLNNSEIADFCLEPLKDFNDVLVTLYNINNSPRPGFEVTYKLHFFNKGTTVLDGIIVLSFDNTKLEYISSTESPSYQTDNSLSFDFSNLLPFENRYIEISYKVFEPPVVVGDDILIFTAKITPTIEDDNESNNLTLVSSGVVNSLDPNNITVLEGEQINIDDSDKFLNYVIRFQNIGTAPAINVRVKNMLDPNLDWDSFELIDMSHKSRVNIENGNEVSFIFDNIYLADSTSNEPESHGYIVYRIKPKPGIDIGDIMSNKADIFFDFNAPVATNTVTTEVANALSVKQNELTNFSVFPIPSSNLLNISSRTEINQIKIFNYFGQLVFTRQVKSGLKENTIDISSIKPGIYFVRIRDENNATGTKKIIKM